MVAAVLPVPGEELEEALDEGDRRCGAAREVGVFAVAGIRDDHDPAPIQVASVTDSAGRRGDPPARRHEGRFRVMRRHPGSVIRGLDGAG